MSGRRKFNVIVAYTERNPRGKIVQKWNSFRWAGSEWVRVRGEVEENEYSTVERADVYEDDFLVVNDHHYGITSAIVVRDIGPMNVPFKLYPDALRFLLGERTRSFPMPKVSAHAMRNTTGGRFLVLAHSPDGLKIVSRHDNYYAAIVAAKNVPPGRYRGRPWVSTIDMAPNFPPVDEN